MKERETIAIGGSSLNERKNLEQFIKTNQWADEIYVTDSGSVDGSVEYCKSQGITLVERPLQGNHNDRAQHALTVVRTDWILLSDPDEVVSDELREEILEILNNGTDYAAFEIKRVNYFLGKPLYHGGWSNYGLKMMRCDKTRYEGESYHERPIIDGKIGRLKGEVYHYPSPNIHWLLQKFNYISEFDAKPYFDQYGVMSKAKFMWMVFYKPFRKWWKSFIWKKGYKDGIHGAIYAALIFAFDMMRICKYAERYIVKNPDIHSIDELPDPWKCRKH